MRLGTHVRLADGREGTVVYNGLDGVGIKWGLHDPDPADFEGTCGDCFEPSAGSPATKSGWPWQPDEMLTGKTYEIITNAGAPSNESQ
jgi:hypothetical protein